MKKRCTQPSYHGYKYYGGKGIKVCAEWQAFDAFREWSVANGYDQSLTIDRLDSAKDYGPTNCQWVTMAENRRRMHISYGHNVIH